MNRPEIVSKNEWLAARMLLLEKEKELDRRRDALSAERRELPCVKIEKEYVFVGPSGRASLRDLFEGRRQLIVYHFMFDPSWEDGRKSCSFLADTFDGGSVHLPARRTVRRHFTRAAREARIVQEANGVELSVAVVIGDRFQLRFQRLVPAGGQGGRDRRVQSFKKEFHAPEAPGVTYNFLDLTPLGRREEDLPFTMSWVRHHDRYDTQP